MPRQMDRDRPEGKEVRTMGYLEELIDWVATHQDRTLEDYVKARAELRKKHGVAPMVRVS